MKTKPEIGFKHPENKIPQKSAFILLLGRVFFFFFNIANTTNLIKLLTTA